MVKKAEASNCHWKTPLTKDSRLKAKNTKEMLHLEDRDVERLNSEAWLAARTELERLGVNLPRVLPDRVLNPEATPRDSEL